MNKKSVEGITVDTESVVQFINLIEKEEWSEEDLNRFVSTKGVQYLIQQEKSGPNFNEDAVKTFLKKANQGFSGELGGWAAAVREKTAIQKRLEYLFSRWNYLVERPLSVVKDYLPEHLRESTCYFLPGGGRESYSDEKGFAINLGRVKRDTHWMFLTAWEGYRSFLTRAAGEEPSIKSCKTPSEFAEAFLSITHRLGIATFVALKASGIEEQFYQEHLDDKKKTLYRKAFQLALEGKAPSEVDRIQETFSGYTSPSAVLGSQMAKALDESIERMGHAMGKDMLRGSVEKLGFISFFKVYKPYETDLSLIPDVVWDAFEMIKKEKGIESAGEAPFFF